MSSPTRLAVRDPLYGDVLLSPEISLLARTPAVQRLRHIRLSNIDSLNMPSIANLSRYEHVVGTAVLASHSGLWRTLNSDGRLLLEAAALLHDAAIAPFGHLVEEALAYVGVAFDHETKWLSLLEAPSPTDLGGIEFPVFFGRVSGLRRWARQVFGSAYETERLRQIFEMVSGNGPLGPFIAGTLDVDNMDNLTRLAYHLAILRDRELPLRLADKAMAIGQGGAVLFSDDALGDLRAWSALRTNVYERLMPAPDDLAGKIMLLASVASAFEAGVLEELSVVWTLTDSQLIDRLLSSGLDDVRSPVERWMVGELWTVTDGLWFRGPCPSIRQMAALSDALQDALGRRCVAYRIKDKRYRRLNVGTTSGAAFQIGSTADTWLLAVGSPIARAFTAGDVRCMVSVVEDFAHSAFVTSASRSAAASPLFDNAT